ncbi:sugar kinase [Rhodococcus sp. ARC_M12]|uniref:sugar kinase n=1 Tax=Rhodococcus sp. ARC_M12 TaxID=2928854 RepID=UPI001FB326E1|nr:sugar kinase [Rhodococcus sp. ARC_M12]MCJ0978593.1 sugar kinase [Rhodococcus sp. ARC_M12]
MKAPRAVCVGEGLVVLVAEPGPLEQSTVFHRTSGGAEANVARVFGQLGVDASWISRVGDDGFGRYLVRQLVGAGVDTSGVAIDAERPTGMYVKERGSGSGDRHDLAFGDSAMTYFRAGSAASALSPNDIRGTASDLIAGADVIHFTGITVAISETAADLTRCLMDSPTVVSFDLNYRQALWKSRPNAAARVLGEHVRGSDVVSMGADEAGLVFGTSDPAELRELFPEPRHLVIKNDAHTVTAFEGNSRVDVPALKLDVVEKIGAGDAFAGGYLTGLLLGKSAVARVRFGHLCAAGALTGHGDIASVLPLAVLTELAELHDADWARLDYAANAVSRSEVPQ